MTNPPGSPKPSSIWDLDTVQEHIGRPKEEKAGPGLVGQLFRQFHKSDESFEATKKWTGYGDIENEVREMGISQVSTGGKLTGAGLFLSGSVPALTKVAAICWNATFGAIPYLGLSASQAGGLFGLSVATAGPFGFAILAVGLLFVGVGIYHARRELIEEGVPVDKLEMSAILTRMTTGFFGGWSMAPLYAAFSAYVSVPMVSWAGGAVNFTFDYTENTFIVFGSIFKGWSVSNDLLFPEISGSGHTIGTGHKSFLGEQIGGAITSFADWLHAPMSTPEGPVKKGGFWVLTTAAITAWTGSQIYKSLTDEEKDKAERKREVEMHEMRQQENLKLEATDGP